MIDGKYQKLLLFFGAAMILFTGCTQKTMRCPPMEDRAQPVLDEIFKTAYEKKVFPSSYEKTSDALVQAAMSKSAIVWAKEDKKQIGLLLTLAQVGVQDEGYFAIAVREVSEDSCETAIAWVHPESWKCMSIESPELQSNMDCFDGYIKSSKTGGSEIIQTMAVILYGPPKWKKRFSP